MLHRMSYREAFFSAVKFQFQSMLFRYESDNDSFAPIERRREFYRLAKYHAATYVFRMKSHDLTSIQVW